MDPGYTLLVDVEKTLYDNDEPFLEFLNDFTTVFHSGTEIRRSEGNYTGEDLNFVPEDVDGWGYDGVYETFAELRGWEENRKEKFMEGDGSGWPGFHEAVDMIWTGELPYKIPLMESDAPENFRRLEELDGVEEVVIGTSRGNFFSDYDVESAVENRLELDFDIKSEEVLFLQEKSGTADIYIDDNPGMDLQEDEEQIAIRTSYNDHLPDEILVDSFSDAVDLVDRKNYIR